MKIVVTAGLIWLLLNACHSEKEKIVSVDPNNDSTVVQKSDSSKNELLKRAINLGDCDAYNKIAAKAVSDLQFNDIYYVSQKMAFKYQCPRAFYYLYRIMNSNLSVDGVPFDVDDEINKNLAKFYILKSFELGYDKARYSIREIFGKESPFPKSEVYLKKAYEHMGLIGSLKKSD